MSATVNGKEYQLAIRIAGIIDRTFTTSLTSAKTGMAAFRFTVNAMDKDFTSLDKSFNKIISVGKKCFDVLVKAATVAATAITAVVAAAANVGSEFESAFAGVKKTVDATEAEYEQLRNNVLEMTRAIPSSASDIAGVMEIAGQLGIATESLTDFTETMINLGVSTNMSAEDAATNLAKFANVVNMADYGEDGISNWERLGSTIVDLGNNFATTESEITEMATRLASTGSLVGLTEAQILALSTAMSSVGIAEEVGGSTMSKLLRKIQLAVETGSDALNDYASVANMTGAEFASAFNDDAVAALSAFIDGLNDTERNGASAVKILNDMGISEVRLSNTILALANADGIMTEAISLANEAWNENTALANEAGKRYETLESKVQFMKNALEEMAIAVYDKVRDPLASGVDFITDKFYELNDFIGNNDALNSWLDDVGTELPTLQRKVKSAWKTVSPFLSGIKSGGEWILKRGGGILGVIEGIGAALVTYKIASNVVHIAKAFTEISKMSGATQSVLGAVGAIGAFVTVATTLYNCMEAIRQERLAESLASHFGSLALSMEELQDVAEYIVSSDSLSAVRAAMEEFDELDSIVDTIDDAVSEINKMNWKVSIGMELTEDEQASYKDAIDEYVQSAQEYALQSQYAVQLNLATGLDGASSETAGIVDKINSFYADCYSEMTSLGEELSAAVNEAFSDNILDPDEITEISDIQAKMAKLQEGIATGEFEAELSAIGMKFSGSELTAESFQNLQSELNAQVDEASQAYRESYTKNYAAAQSALDAGSITGDEFTRLTDELQKAYLDNLSEITQKAATFQLNTINDTYLSGLMGNIPNSDLGFMRKNATLDTDVLSSIQAGTTEDPLSDYFYTLMENVLRDSATSDAIAELLEQLAPTAEQLESLKAQYEELGMAVPESILSGLQQYEMLQGVADGDIESIYNAIGASIAGTEYADLILQMDEQGRSIPQAVIDGINNASEGVDTEVAALYTTTSNLINETFSQGFSVSADVSVALNPYLRSVAATTPKSSSLSGVKHNANGGIWDAPILTTFAENGPEAAIPLDGSSNAINLWEQTGRLLGMDSVLDSLSLEGGTGPTIEYSPVLKFYGDSPSKDDISEALSISQEQFEELMARYLKTNGRVSFG